MCFDGPKRALNSYCSTMAGGIGISLKERSKPKKKSQKINAAIPGRRKKIKMKKPSRTKAKKKSAKGKRKKTKKRRSEQRDLVDKNPRNVHDLGRKLLQIGLKSGQ